MSLIFQNDGIIQKDLAREMDMRPSSMTEMLMRNEKHGFIVRRQDEKEENYDKSKQYSFC
ncbi:MarR family transcriptional regulator [Clostridium pasteurianum]|uniref:MarR family transcriptional regulator n=1 Tax=Clostridium pasteurianum TaxID=1501 RepID=UPI0006883B35|nr:MarR family transcriptional regulator [Clostridium pasteurianum]